MLALDQGDFEGAEGFFSRIPEYRQTGSFSNNVGILYFMKGETALAKRYFEKAVRAESENRIYRFSLGDALWAMGDLEQARIHFAQALDLLESKFENLARNGLDSASSASDGEVVAHRYLLRALLGNCEGNSAESDPLGVDNDQLEPTRDLSIYLSRAYAICGARDRAAVWVAKGKELGLDESVFSVYPELAWIKQLG